MFWPLRANHGGPSGDTNLSANLTDKNVEKLETMVSSTRALFWSYFVGFKKS